MKKHILAAGASSLLVLLAPSHAAIITFDEVVAGKVEYAYDGDADGIDDVIFSTEDPLGFNTVGPGPDMVYINEPGIEGSTKLPVDLRVEFLFGATSNITFGFALSVTQNIYGVTFEVYDHADSLLGSINRVAVRANETAGSTFPEALLSLDFDGVAAYGLFKFDDEPQRYIIDNFSGAFGSLPEAQGTVITDYALIPEGFIIKWIPVMGLDSAVKCSNDLYLPYTDLVTLPFPVNSYTVTTHRADRKCFYKVRLIPQ